MRVQCYGQCVQCYVQCCVRLSYYYGATRSKHGAGQRDSGGRAVSANDGENKTIAAASVHSAIHRYRVHTPANSSTETADKFVYLLYCCICITSETCLHVTGDVDVLPSLSRLNPKANSYFLT